MADADIVECNSTLEATDYDEGLHVGAFFIVLVTSFVGGVFPLVANRCNVTVDSLPFACAKLFGAGIILSTALIHMFPPAAANLTNPCLSAAFTDEYPAYAGLFALLAILVVQAMQLGAAEVLRRHASRTNLLKHGTKATKSSSTDPEDSPFSSSTKTEAAEDGDRLATTFILELGIASHSIIIGIALGTATEEFRTLLIALVFHQFFEGMSLATVILECNLRSRITPFFMIFIYSLTTPVGIAIGIGVHSSYSESDATVLLSTGILDALSAGILIYNALVGIMHAHLSSDKFRVASGWAKMAQLTTMWLGVAIMALLGRWA